MIYHIVVGDVAAAPLKEAIAAEPSMEGEVLVIKDVLSVGPLQKGEGQSFSELRTAFWQEVINNDKNPVQVDDMERLLEMVLALSKNEDDKVWLWMAPWPADVCTYLWTIKYLGKYMGRFFVVNIAGLPFLDDNGKVFFPRSLGEIPAKELVKARRLARAVTPAEVEVDGDDWRKLVAENAGVRVHEGGKKITSKGADHYDNQLMSFCTQSFQKASKVVGQALSKFNIPTGDVYLGWRLRQIAATDKLRLQGDTTKTLRDFDVKVPSGEIEFGATNETVGVP